MTKNIAPVDTLVIDWKPTKDEPVLVFDFDTVTHGGLLEHSHDLWQKFEQAIQEDGQGQRYVIMTPELQKAFIDAGLMYP